MYFSQENYDQAVAFYQRSQSLAKKSGDRQIMASTLGGLANVYYARGKYRDAIRNYEKALDVSRQIGDRRNECTWLNNLGQCYRALVQKQHRKYQRTAYLQRAEEYYLKAVALAQDISFNDAEMIAQTNLGHIYALDMGDAKRGQVCYEHAIELLERTRGMLVEESHRIGFFGQALDAYNGLVALHLAKANWLDAWTTIEKARSRTLVEQLAQTTLSPPSTVAASLLDEEKHWLFELRRLSLALRNASDSEASSLADQVESAQQALDAVLERMNFDAADYVALRRGTPTEFSEIRKLLKNVA
jgi:tetratricopeptide (TPR) repeat protein